MRTVSSRADLTLFHFLCRSIFRTMTTPSRTRRQGRRSPQKAKPSSPPHQTRQATSKKAKKTSVSGQKPKKRHAKKKSASISKKTSPKKPSPSVADNDVSSVATDPLPFDNDSSYDADEELIDPSSLSRLLSSNASNRSADSCDASMEDNGIR